MLRNTRAFLWSNNLHNALNVDALIGRQAAQVKVDAWVLSVHVDFGIGVLNVWGDDVS